MQKYIVRAGVGSGGCSQGRRRCGSHVYLGYVAQTAVLTQKAVQRWAAFFILVFPCRSIKIWIKYGRISKIQKGLTDRIRKPLILLAPHRGLEPRTRWLTVTCSTDWANVEYYFSNGCRLRTHTIREKQRIIITRLSSMSIVKNCVVTFGLKCWR